MFDKAVWQQGEALAVAFLKKQKYKILSTNYKTKLGEIDIVAQDGNMFIFIEVKARSSQKFGLPREAVTSTKQQKIRRVAQEFLIARKNYPAAMRFDVIEILDRKINAYIKNAF